MKFLEGASVLLVYLVYVLGPVIVLATIMELLAKTKLGRRFERWLFEKLDIGNYED